jgi:hypothetical protein
LHGTLRFPGRNDLYQWIATNTLKDAVLLVAYLRIPPLARRGLYITVDVP